MLLSDRHAWEYADVRLYLHEGADKDIVSQGTAVEIDRLNQLHPFTVADISYADRESGWFTHLPSFPSSVSTMQISQASWPVQPRGPGRCSKPRDS